MQALLDAVGGGRPSTSTSDFNKVRLDPPRPGDKLNDWERGEDAGKAFGEIRRQSVTDHYSTHEILRFLAAAMFGRDEPANQIPIYEAAVRCVERMLAATTA